MKKCIRCVLVGILVTSVLAVGVWFFNGRHQSACEIVVRDSGGYISIEIAKLTSGCPVEIVFVNKDAGELIVTEFSLDDVINTMPWYMRTFDTVMSITSSRDEMGHISQIRVKDCAMAVPFDISIPVVAGQSLLVCLVATSNGSQEIGDQILIRAATCAPR